MYYSLKDSSTTFWALVNFVTNDARLYFKSSKCEVIDIKNNKIILIGHRQCNIYIFDLNDLSSCEIECLAAMNSDESWLWYKRLWHISMSILENVSKYDLVKELSKIKFKNDKICDACQKRKQTRISFKSINMLNTTCPLQLLHMDLFRPSRTLSLVEKRYAYALLLLMTILDLHGHSS